MASQEILGKLEDMVQCPVCLEQFTEPRSLPCQHSFCTECLQGLLGSGRNIRCPCCIKETPVPNGVRQLPVDFRANTLLETISQAAAAREAGVPHREGGAETALGAFGVLSLDECCPVCDEIPTLPMKLSCGHSLCRSCVQFLLPVGGVTLHCPECACAARIMPSSIRNPATSSIFSPPENAPAEDQLTFHRVCGENAVILANKITAQRRYTKVIESNALVLTSRHLKPNEPFEVRLDKKVEKWSSSLEIGVTMYSPTESELPASMYELGSGTWFMRYSKIWQKVSNKWISVKQDHRDWQDLGKLKVGDRVGVQRGEDGSVHFYVNGVDVFVAEHVPAAVYGVISVGGKAAEITITDTPVLVPSMALRVDRRPRLQIGQKVRVKPGVVTPNNNWGSVTHRSVGTIKALDRDNQTVRVEFPESPLWTGLMSEMEPVPSTQPDTRWRQGYRPDRSELTSNYDSSSSDDDYSYQPPAHSEFETMRNRIRTHSPNVQGGVYCGNRGSRGSRGGRGGRGSQDSRGGRGGRGGRGSRGSRGSRDRQGSQDRQDWQDRRDRRDSQGSQDSRESRDRRDRRDSRGRGPGSQRSQSYGGFYS